MDTQKSAQNAKYRGEIREIGSMVPEFLPHGILIFFGANAPQELRDTSLVHDGEHLVSEIVSGDILTFSPPSETQSPQTFRITSVGDSANTNLDELGHIVLHFDGATEASLPGAVSVEPALKELPIIGTVFEISGQKE